MQLRSAQRVLMFCPTFRPIVGGAERQAEKLGIALARSGISVEIWTPRLDPSSPTAESIDGLRICRFWLPNAARHYPRLRGFGMSNALWMLVRIVGSIWRATGDADLVHCHIGSLESVAAGLAARLRGKPVICKAALGGGRSDLGEIRKTGMMGWFVERGAIRVFTRWVGTTEAVRAGLLAAGIPSAKIAVIPNGVEMAETTNSLAPRPIRHFLYLGRLSRNSGRDVPTLIAAFDLLASQIPDVKLAIVGDGDLLDEIRTLVQRAAAAARIELPGAGDPSTWLNWADCFVLPSRREGLSNALLEAMAHGVACIANDIPANREVLAEGEAGVLVPVGNTTALTTEMLSLALNEATAGEIARRGRERAESHYSIDRIASRYRALYDELVVSA